MSIKFEINSEVVDLLEAPVRINVNSGPGIDIGVSGKNDVTIGIDRRPPIQIELNARRTLEGNILIMDHRSIDIVVMPSKNKFLTIAKEVIHEDVYGAQDRLGKFMTKRGIVDPSTIRSGNIFGSMEYQIMESKIPGVDNIQATLYTIHKYIISEQAHSSAGEEHYDKVMNNLLEPSDKQSTDLGDVVQEPFKGSVDSRVRPFGYQYNYSLIREEEEKGSE